MFSFRIDFSIKRCDDGSGEYVEIGFGGSSGAGTIDSAAYEVETLIQRREWETSPGMPDPYSVETGGE